jgi:hypothetical protein
MIRLCKNTKGCVCGPSQQFGAVRWVRRVARRRVLAALPASLSLARLVLYVAAVFEERVQGRRGLRHGLGTHGLGIEHGLGVESQVEISETAGKNNMVQMAKESRGQAAREIIDLLHSSQRKSWAPLLFGPRLAPAPFVAQGLHVSRLAG